MASIKTTDFAPGLYNYTRQLHVMSDVRENEYIHDNLYSFVARPNENIKILQKVKRLLSYYKSHAHSFSSEKYYLMFSEKQICNIVIVVCFYLAFGFGHLIHTKGKYITEYSLNIISNVYIMHIVVSLGSLTYSITSSDNIVM